MASLDRGLSGPHLARLLSAWRSGGPAYAALAAAIRLLVLDGRLPLRTRLPGERELADALGVHYQTVGYLERGEYNPSLELALRIAAFFDVPVEAIFSLAPFPRITATKRSVG